MSPRLSRGSGDGSDGAGNGRAFKAGGTAGAGASTSGSAGARRLARGFPRRRHPPWSLANQPHDPLRERADLGRGLGAAEGEERRRREEERTGAEEHAASDGGGTRSPPAGEPEGEGEKA